MRSYFLHIVAFVFLCFGNSLVGQVVDSSSKHYTPPYSSISEEELHSYLDLTDSITKYFIEVPKTAQHYAKIYLAKAKKDTSSLQKARGYHLMAGTGSKTEINNLKYLDSSLSEYNLKGKHFYYPAIVYMNKGSYYESKGDLNEAVQNHLASAEYADAAQNERLFNYAKFNLAHLKKRLKKYNEAERLLKETIVYEEKKPILKLNDSISQLLNFVDLTEVLRLNNKLEEAKSINESITKQYGTLEEAFLFTINAAALASSEQDFEKAKKILNLDSELESKLLCLRDFDTLFYYITLSLTKKDIYKNTSNYRGYLKQLRLLDSLYRKTGYLDYRFKDVYRELLVNSRATNNKQQELSYIERYLSLDSLITENLQPIDERINENYDRKQLIEEKEKIIVALSNKNLLKNVFLTAATSMILFLSVFFMYRRKLAKKKLGFLLEELDKKKEPKHKQTKIQQPSRDNANLLDDDTFNRLALKIAQFETEKGFLERNVNLNNLAKRLNTNSKYLSTYINQEKRQNFSSYINNLRVDYFLEKSRSDSTFQKYTIKAIAYECGFNSSEVFSKYFYKKTGIRPSYYLKNVNI